MCRHTLFNLLTSPELLNFVEAELPEHREREYPPTADTVNVFRTSDEFLRFLPERSE